MKSYTLVLGGGGARGVYQIGAWKALRELGIKIHAVIGTSIGTINGAFIIQNEFNKAMDFWDRIELDTALNIPKEMIKNGEFILNSDNLDKIAELQKSIIENAGVDTTPLRQLIGKYVNEEKIRKSKIDYGLVSFNLTNFKALEIFIENIPKGKLIDYIMASSALPGLKQVRIDGKIMLDGGVADVVPYNLAKRRGYRNIIAVDVSGPGLHKKPDIIRTETIYIKNSADLGGIIETDKVLYKRNINLGYMDTMKAFGKMKGHKYTYFDNFRLKKKLNKFIRDNNDEIIRSAAFDKSENSISELLPYQFSADNDIAGVLTECAAFVLKIPSDRPYEYGELVCEIIKSYRSIVGKKKEYEDYNIIDLLVKAIRDKRNLLNLSLIEYDFALSFLFSGDQIKKWTPGEKLSSLAEELYGARMFFYLIEKNLFSIKKLE